MSDLHIDDFYRDCARIFAQLYKHFPRRGMIYTEDIAGPDTPDDFGLPSDRHQACFSAMQWLADNGFIEYGSTVAFEALDQVVLCHKGFNLLCTIETNEQYSQLVSKHADPTQQLDPSYRSRCQILRHILKHESSITLAAYMRYLLAL